MRPGRARPTFALVALALGLWLVLAPAPLLPPLGIPLGATDAIADITYIYDALGRLRAVVDPASDSAITTYDAVGNILSIVRHASSVVDVIEVAPATGPVGTTVTIFGTGFSATPSQNTVTFNGLTAFVSASTATEITTSVPAGATTGTIQVTAPGGSATSANPFTVAAAAGAPAITGFTPTLGSPGTPVSVTGSNFDPDVLANKLRINLTPAAVSAATPTSLSTTVPPGAGSGRLRVTTPTGTGVSAADFFIPPPGYTAGQVATTGRIAYGQPFTTPVIPSGQVGLLVFDGTAGQRVSLVTTGAGFKAWLYQPNGQLVVFWYIGNQFSDVIVLPAAGTSTLLLEGGNAAVTVTLYDVPPDVTGTITPGGPAVPVTITTPGQNAHLTFTGALNQVVSLTLSTPGFAGGTLILRQPPPPDGTPLVTLNPWGFLDRTTLPAAGTYTIDLDPFYANTGTLTVTLYDVVDVTGSLTINGPGVLVDITVPGQNARLTFAGTQSQPLSLVVTGAAGRAIAFRVFNPDGSLHWSGGIQGWINITLQVTPLTQTGTHTLEVDYGGAATGTVTVGLTSP